MINKKMRNCIIAATLVAVVGIGGTLAYLSGVTDMKTNTFTMGKGITGSTEEPEWENSGKDDAQNFVPGKVIAKDPQIKNTSEASTGSVWAAATITYQMKQADDSWIDTTYADLDQFINVKSGTADGFSTDWTMENDNKIAFYNTELAAQTSTSPVFSAIEVDKLALTPEQVLSGTTTNPQFDMSKYTETDAQGNVKEYQTYQMKDFRILVTGYIVQTEGFADCKTAMTTAFPDVFQ